MSSIPFALALITSYALIGAGIKLVDQAVDDPSCIRFRKHLLWLVVAGLIILVNIWIFLDVYTAVLALGIILSLIASRKIDNTYFILLAITVFPLTLFRFFDIAILILVLPTLIAIFIASLLDEVLHAHAYKIQNAALRRFLLHRPILKICVVILPLFGLLTFIHTIGFWCFDIAYDALAYYFGAKSFPNAEIAPT
ncbi:MAG: hypothetical protein ACFE9D_00060 [Promethearchaeota archaeon]